MKLWAWIWLTSIIVVGWAPALVVAYVVAFVLAVVAGLPGPMVYGATYVSILLTGVAGVVQLGRYLRLARAASRWLTWGGSGALVLVWGGAYVTFAAWAGWIH